MDRNELAEVFDVEPTTIGKRLLQARKALLETMQTAGYHDAATFTGPEAFDAWARFFAVHRKR